MANENDETLKAIDASTEEAEHERVERVVRELLAGDRLTDTELHALNSCLGLESARLAAAEQTIAEYREFDGILARIAYEEWYGRLQDGAFCIFDADGEGIASGATPFEAWQNAKKEGEKE